MGYFVIGIVVVAVLAGFALFVHLGFAVDREKNNVGHWWVDVQWGIITGSIIAILIIGIAWLVVYTSGTNENARLEAFYFANLAHLALAEEKIREGIDGDIIDTELFFLGYDAQQAGHITVYASRVSTNLEEIKAYNVALLRKYKWQDSFMNGIFNPNIDPNLKMVRVITE